LPASEEIRHNENHRALVDNLTARLKPVRPLWPVRRRLTLWLAIEAAILIGTLIGTSNRWALKLEDPLYMLEITFFAGAAVIVAAMALRTAIPGRASPPWQRELAVALAVTGTAMLFLVPTRTDLSLGAFVAVGSGCAWATCAKGVVPWIALWWAVKRGAPGNGSAAGAMVGAAAMLFSFAIMRLDCPLDEPLHLMTWHMGPVVLVTTISALAGALWLRWPPPASAGAS
jgi:hypothetical protein